MFGTIKLPLAKLQRPTCHRLNCHKEAAQDTD